MPHSLSNPNQIVGSVSTLSAGDSPAFTSSTTFDSTSGAGVGTGYCTVNSLLSLGGRTDGFALCRNSSTLAAGRMDVVFEPKAGHENYVLEECKKVVIKMV
ncbi:hypothetical protein VNI00_009810 [Paramarasmius palmivorus]|uniref:Uncharacterized protein n=1 Tax=Paramarasmius palmivorus TaxID=297713 RepID=A0AAW0CMH7_9AGAR